MVSRHYHQEKTPTTTSPDTVDLTVMAGRRASRLALAALVVCSAAVGAKVTDSCCGMGDGNTCCPKPSIVDNANNLLLPEDTELRVAYDPKRCCSDDSAVGCTAYGVAGCTFCRNVCEEDDDSCVVCPVASDQVFTTVPREPEDDDTVTTDTDDFSQVDDFDARQNPGSYDFSDDPDQYECSNCSWDSMSTLKQRLLTQRSRSMVCDSSCLHDSGDPNYGVTLCNYFNAGKECRACCHVSPIVHSALDNM